MNPPTIENTEYVFRGKIIDVSVSEVKTASGVPAFIEMVHHPGGAAALPLFDDGSTILVRQYRYPLRRMSLEIPAGRMEPGQSALETAARELEEETGYRALNFSLISAFYPTPGFCQEKLFVYLATDLTPTRQNLDVDEDIELVRMSVAEAVNMVQVGEIDDAKTIIALLHAERMVK
jgi:ADP-ribose pyrophosphatase